MAHPAIVRNLGIPVTLHAKTHFKRFFHYDAVHPGDVAVTFAAIYARLYVRLMAEVNKFLQNIYPFPFYGDLAVIMVSQVGNLRIMNYYPAVAKHTGFERRYPGDVGINRLRVAKYTAYSFFRRVYPMAEWNRLLGPYSTFKPECIRQHHTQKHHPGYNGENDRITEHPAILLFFRNERSVLIHPIVSKLR